MWDYIVMGFMNFFEPINFVTAVVGVTAGIMFGCLPGFTATMAVAVCVPFSFYLTPAAALLLLSGIFCGAIYAGSIPAVLIGIPGTPASVPTSLEGPHLTKRGEAGKALHWITLSAATGGIFSALALIFFSPALAMISLKFGPPEMMMLAFFGLSVTCMLTAENMVKGVLVGFVSLLLGVIGQDPVEGYPRYIYGFNDLLGGVPLIPVLIGIFSLPEVFLMIEGGMKKTAYPAIGSMALKPFEYLHHWWLIIKSGIIGVFIGIMPAAGPDVAAFLAYNEAKRSSKEPEKFGKGAYEGILAADISHNACTGGDLIPVLTLSIPGSAAAAVFLGALYIHGLRPGPRLFTEHADVSYTMLVGFLMINIMMYFIGLVWCKGACKVVKTPRNVLAPLVVMVTIIGSFATDNSMFNVWIMFICGIIGYIMVKNDLPVSPVCLGLILGPMLEQSMQQSLIMFHGNFWLTFTRPIAVLFFVLGAVSLLWPYFIDWIEKRKARKAAVGEQ